MVFSSSCIPAKESFVGVTFSTLYLKKLTYSTEHNS